jgi:hypothetical protein
VNAAADLGQGNLVRRPIIILAGRALMPCR